MHPPDGRFVLVVQMTEGSMEIRRPEPGGIRRAYASADDAIRAIQGLTVAGIPRKAISVEARETTDAVAIGSATGIPAGGAVAGTSDEPVPDGIVVIVDDPAHAELARNVLVDGLVDGAGMTAPREAGVYMDPSTGSTAGVATSTGTATGIAPGAGYEGNTGSTAMTTTGPLGQFAPSADSPDPEDDFPSGTQG